MEITRPQKAKRYNIFVGMRDMDTLEQKNSTQKILSVTEHCLQNYDLSYSYHLQTGGYKMQNSGTYIQENSLCITLVDADEAVVQELAADICCFIHQESVMILVDEVQICFLSETVSPQE